MTAQAAAAEERLVRMFRGVSCFHCGKHEAQGQRFMCCGGCEMLCYCSKECQRADWRRHRAECKSHIARKAEFQAQGTGEQDEQYEDWYKHRMSIFHTVTRELVGYRTQTHVVVVKVDHHPSKTPPFQVTGIEAVPLAAVGPEFPQIHHKITSAPRPANCKGLNIALLVLDINTIPRPKIMPIYLPACPSPGNRAGMEPILISKCVKLLNMDAYEALALIAARQ